MASGEEINASLMNVKSIPDAELDELLVFTQKPKPNEEHGVDSSQFQYHQNLDVLLDTTALFCDNNETAPKDKTQKYPTEFNLSFPIATPDPTLIMQTQKTLEIELSCESIVIDSKMEESIFVHPQLKDEPLDLSVPSLQYSALETASNLEKHVIDDFDLELIVDPVSPKEFSFQYKSPEQENEDPYQIEPSTSRPPQSNSEQISPMEVLALNYSQASLEIERPTTTTDFHSTQNEQYDTTKVPSSVQRLYETIKISYSDFTFVYSLAAQMCQDRIPMDCFVHLKIGLLLSIASLEDNPDRPPISVVAIGPEFDMANHLMENIGNVAQRFVGPHDDFKTPSTASRKSTHIWIEADPIVMAKGGIYYVGDWGRLKAARSFKIFKTIECGRVALEKTTVSCPLETAIWTHWRSFKNDKKDESLLSKFFEIFGVPLLIEEDNHECLIDMMLEQASTAPFESTIDELSVSSDDMRNYLSVVAQRRVDLTHDASEVLRKYFVASRMDRPDCLTQKSFTTLKLFAESFAKLSMRHDVIMVDAIAAIYMTENVIQSIFGPGAFPPPKFKTHTFVETVDKHLAEFHEWVKSYVSQFLD